jgi:hypothetical protein
VVGAINTDDSDTFAVVSKEKGPVTMYGNGVLYFYANDKEGRYFNNHGTVMLRITREN